MPLIREVSLYRRMMMEANGSMYSRLSRGKKLLMFIMSIAVLGIITGFSVNETMKTEINLSLDGTETIVKSHGSTVKDILEQELANTDKKLDEENDFVEPALNTKVEDGMDIIWRSAKNVTLNIDNQEETIVTAQETVEDVLSEQRIIVDEHVEITPGLSATVKDNMTITVTHALEIPLVVGGEKEKVWTTAETVAELLKEKDIELGDLDRVKPGIDENIKKDTSVHVIRVEKKTDVVEENVDYKTVTRKDSSIAKGKEKVLQAGKNGKVKKEYEVTLENGKEVKRKLQKEDILKESQDHIVAVGTKRVTKSVSRSAPSGGKTLYMASTAYTANCSGCSGVTATGINLKANPNTKVIAVDPNVIPLGTKVYVDGYGYAIAGDTGGAITGNRIDVFFPSSSKAYSWGSKTVKVKILN